MRINQLKKRALSELGEVKDLAGIERFRIRYLGRKGKLTAALRSLKDLPVGQRKIVGLEANRFKNELRSQIANRRLQIEKLETSRKKEKEKIDITAPGIKLPQGHLHPITQLLRQTEEIFQSMGFEVVEGPDIETEYYNFDALNVPDEHPARDAWDTFWLKTKPEKLLLRTHTSPMQIRYMEKNNPPFRIIVPGRTFRYEATDASHSHTFYQLEGLMVDKDINVANFKAIIQEFLRKLFGEDVKMKMIPTYYPFVEPGFDIQMKFSSGKWMEIMGAGMVHPNVFKAIGYNPANWQGFAFGVGLERIAMIKYGINDIRLFYGGDLRFLKQF
jgi:phenylalanyl-tRNA synthetase alpha chain